LEWSPTSIILKRGDEKGKERVRMERGGGGEEKREKVGVNGREIRTVPKAKPTLSQTALFSKRNETVKRAIFLFLFLSYFYVL
jgi:hypothetical protein